jgi:Tfp pilus assembly protein FimT
MLSPRAAFSFVEIIVVTLIMGILAFVAMPTFYRSLQHHHLESASRRVKLDLEQLRHTAQMKSQTQTVTIPGGTIYTLSSGEQELDSNGQTYTVDLAQPPYELDSAAVNFGGPTSVSFDGYGMASASGTIVLQLGNATRTVTLDKTNGSITVTDP